MHLLESYALVSACLIDKCFIHEEAIDLPSNPYITFHPFNPKGTDRNYSHWQKVIDTIYPIIKNQTSIIQIGGKYDTRLKHVSYDYLGKTNYNSLAYLIKNAILHIGFDSLPMHIASHYDKKIVAIFPRYIENSKPYFSSPHNIKLIMPDYSIIKPIYGDDDPLKRIDTISPNIIVDAIMELLNINVK